MTLKKLKSFVQNEYAFSFFSKIVGIIIAMLYSVLYNRYLGAILKGDAAIIANYISIISSFTCFGMYQAYPYYRRKDKEIFYPFLNNMISFNLLLLAVAIVLCLFINVDFNIKFAIILVPVYSFVRHINYMVMVECPTRRNISYLIIHIADVLVVAFFFVFTNASYKNLIYILIVQNVINLTISYANLKANIKKLRFSLSNVVKYMKFGFLPMITLFLMTVNYRIDVLMLQGAQNVDKAAIGVYSVGVMLAEKVWLLPDSMKDILLSHLCKGADKEEVSKIIRVCLAMTIMLVVSVAILGKPFINILYGSAYDGAYSITVIMRVGVIGMIFYKMVYAYHVSQGKRLINMMFLALSALINVIGNYFFIPVWGVNGAAFVSVISYTICGIAFLVYFHKKTNSPYKEMLILKRTDLDVIKRLIKR